MTASAHFTSELQRSLGSGESMSSPVSGRCHRCVSAIVLAVNDSKHSKQGTSTEQQLNKHHKQATHGVGMMGTGCQQEMKTRDVVEAGRRQLEGGGHGGTSLPSENCWLCQLSLTAKLSFSQKFPDYISFKEMASPAIPWTVFLLWCRDSIASTNLSSYSTQKLLLLLGCLFSDHCQPQHPSCNAASQASS